MALLSQERFDSGETYQQVHERMLAAGGRSQRGLEYGEWAASASGADLSAFASLDEPVNVLVLSEDWCPDCTDNLPILNYVAEQTGKVNLRIFSRDENKDIADQFLYNGEFSKIPTIIVLDQQFNVLGHVIERPDSVTALRLEARKAVLEARPELGSIDTHPRDLPADVLEARIIAETEIKREHAAWAVNEVVQWVATALKPAPVAV
jgi:thiol-disulfide isomerase/thioredoxin